MKMKSKSNRNLSFLYKGGNVLVPAGATLELADEVYKRVKATMAATVEAGLIVITEAPAKSKKELAAEKAEAVEAAKALLAEETPDKETKKDK